jgi:mannose-6-phosphate isomerase-like protein (cupin superfamily)
MQKLMPGLLVVLFALFAAETKPTAATYVTSSDIQAIFKQAPENGVSDKQIRSVSVGKVNVAVAGVYRSAKANNTSIEHDQVTEVYTIIEGSGTMVTGGKMANPERLKPDDPTVKVLVGPSMRGGALEGGESHKVGPGDMIIVPPGVPHWFSSIDGAIRYSVVRVDPDKLLPPK